MPESRRHMELRTLLFQLLRAAFGDVACIGSDQFVYWNAANPRRCLAPDVFVRLGVPDHDFGSWTTWKDGAPELAIEIASDYDRDDPVLDEKLARYHELGVDELVWFDFDAPLGQRLRAWDRVDGDLVERTVEGDRTPSRVLGGAWVVAPMDDVPVALRLEQGGVLVATANETKDARIAELEAELVKRG